MWKLQPAVVILSALFCLCQSKVPQDYVDKISSVKSYYAEYDEIPKIVILKNRTYAVILKEHTLNLTSGDTGTDKPQEVLSCKLETSHQFWHDNLNNVMKVLGNGKLVVVTPAKRSIAVHIIIDPFDCSSQKIVSAPSQHPDAEENALAVIPYHDSYDVITNYVFSKDSIKEKNFTMYPKNPQRFNDKGEQIELDYSLKPDPTSEETSGWFKHLFQINTIKPFDASEGYYCTYYTDSRGTVLQRLNSRFETVKEVTFRGSGNDHVSITNGYINYCTFGEKDTCKLLNADLEVQATSNLPNLNLGNGRKTYKVINLPNHQGLVVLLSYKHVQFYSSAPVDFYLQRIDAGGAALPHYWKIGHLKLLIYDIYENVNSGKDFCYAIVSTEMTTSRKIIFRNFCLELYAY